MAYRTDMTFNKLKNNIDNIFKKIDLQKFTTARWFQDKGSEISGVEVYDYFISNTENDNLFVIPLIANFKVKISGKEILYYIPIILSGDKLNNKEHWLEIIHKDYNAYIYSAINCKQYSNILMGSRRKKTANNGCFSVKQIAREPVVKAISLTEDTSNSLTLIKKDIVVKTYRKLNPGINIDIEIAEVLQERTNFNNIPELYAYAVYKDSTGREYSLCLLQEYIKNQQTLWQRSKANIMLNLKNAGKNIDKGLSKYRRNYVEEIRRAGRLIADLHIALAAGFKAEEPEVEDIKSWINEQEKVINKLYKYLETKNMATVLSGKKNKLLKTVNKLLNYRQNSGKYIRIHGDLHLEQLLRHNDNFIILDFEGEPLKDIEYRRKKYSPLKDIAGMMRSFSYVSILGYKQYIKEKKLYNQAQLKKVVEDWEISVSNNFLEGYLQQIEKKNKRGLIPPGENFQQILGLFILEKALYEAIYELNNRPDWLDIPLAGIQNCLNSM